MYFSAVNDIAADRLAFLHIYQHTYQKYHVQYTEHF